MRIVCTLRSAGIDHDIVIDGTDPTIDSVVANALPQPQPFYVFVDGHTYPSSASLTQASVRDGAIVEVIPGALPNGALTPTPDEARSRTPHRQTGTPTTRQTPLRIDPLNSQRLPGHWLEILTHSILVARITSVMPKHRVARLPAATMTSGEASVVGLRGSAIRALWSHWVPKRMSLSTIAAFNPTLPNS